MSLFPLLFDVRPFGASPGRGILRVERWPPVFDVIDNVLHRCRLAVIARNLEI
jgi:hypothetical protein